MIATQDQEANEPGGRYIDFLVPGLLGMGLMGGGLWGVGYAIVDMRIRKLLKRYLATPMRRSHFLLSVIVSRLLFTLPEVVLLLVFARLIFGVASMGSYGTIGLLIVLGVFRVLGYWTLGSQPSQTIETVSGLMNAVMLPMYIGSGIFFSTERFPDAVQPVLQIPAADSAHSRLAEHDTGRREPAVAWDGLGDDHSVGRRDVCPGPAVVPLEVKRGKLTPPWGCCILFFPQLS